MERFLGWRRMEPRRWRTRFAENKRGWGVEWSWKRALHVGYWWSRGGHEGDVDQLYLALGCVCVWISRDRASGTYMEEKRKGWEFTWDHWQRWFGNPDEESEHVFCLWRDHLWDRLFGKTICTIREGREQKLVIQMPEGPYDAVATFKWYCWARPRWPFRKLRPSTDVNIEGGIPFSGKGENSWDCGEDGLWGTGCTGHDLDKAAAHVRKCVLDSRVRRGDPANWTDRNKAGAQ
jgi:hypothetical protein